MKQNTFLKNTLIILFTSFMIKMLGLLNKIIVTNLLGTNGMNIYVLTMPTIILLTSLSSLSLNIVISKIISENRVNKKYSERNILKSSILLSLVMSFFVIILLLLFIHPLVTTLLKNDKLFFPILSSVFLIPLVGISDALRGYFNGIKHMKYSSLSTLIEQVARIISTIIMILFSIKYNAILSVSLCVIGLAIGEVASIIYSIIKIKKLKISSSSISNGETKRILKEAIPTTLSRLVNSFSHFLEPIIYTNILLFLLYDYAYINATYTTITAYVLPFITLTAFVSNAVATSIIPGISECYAKNNNESLCYYVDKAFVFSLVPGLFSCTIFYLFAEEYLSLLFGVSEGVNLIKYTVFLTIPYYLQSPFTSILQAIGKNKFLLILTIALNLLKLILLTTLPLIPTVNVYSLLVSLILIIFLDSAIMYIVIKRNIKYSINVNELFNILLQFIFVFGLTYLMKQLNLNFIIITLLSLIILIISSIKLNLLSIDSIKNLFNKKNLD